MATVFFVAFGLGAGFVVLSFLIGEFSGEIEADSALSFIKPSIISTFLVVFGIVGILLEAAELTPFAALNFAIAFFAGFFMSLALNRFILIPLRKLESTSAADIQMIIGLEAKVTEGIPQGGYGKISFLVNDNKHNAPAKSEDGNQIELYASVEIIYIEKNTYFVREKKQKK